MKGDIEVSIHRSKLVLDRIVCVKCPAVATLHHVFKWQFQVYVWAECHGAHVFGTLDEIHVRRVEFMDRSTLFEEIRPCDDEWLTDMRLEMSRTIAEFDSRGATSDQLHEIARRIEFVGALSRFRDRKPT